MDAFQGREAVSKSYINKFRVCPEQFRRHYITRDRPFTGSGNTLWGSADHRAIQAEMEQRIATGEGYKTVEVTEFFAEEVERIYRNEGEIEWDGADFEGKTPAANVAQIKDRGTKLVAAYHQQVCPTMIPVSVEEKFDLEIPGLPLRVLGYIDLRVKRTSPFAPEGGPTVIVERKTRSKSMQRVKGDEMLGAAIYQLARPEPVQFHLSVKLQTPKLVGCFGELDAPLAPTERTIDVIWRTLIGISQCYDTYGPDEPWPDQGATSQMMPPCRFCSARPNCRWAN